MCAILSGIGIALYTGPLFGIISIAYFPFIITLIVIFSKKVRKATFSKLAVLKRLGGVVEEVLFSIKLIVSFAQEEKEI